MRSSMQCPKCGTTMQGGVPSCPQCAPAAPEPVAPAEVRRLPLLEEYVAHGYQADRYGEFISQAKQQAAIDGAAVEVRAPTAEEQAELTRALEARAALLAAERTPESPDTEVIIPEPPAAEERHRAPTKPLHAVEKHHEKAHPHHEKGHPHHKK